MNGDGCRKLYHRHGDCCIVPPFRNGVEMHSEDADVDEEDGANLFQVWETVRITQPKPWYCYGRDTIEDVFFFLWPFINMLTKKNYPLKFVGLREYLEKTHKTSLTTIYFSHWYSQ
mmetsp:Transcript_3319/g.5141  ORF Transcript_3319/g.5141 Transcript_3319/m.5141 type:complete len:116 (+) Transcript_3319:679-1026(+)